MIILLFLLVFITGYFVVAEIVFEHDWPLRTIRGFLISLLLLFMGLQVFGQTASRYDNIVSTINQSAPIPGGLYPALYIPNSGVNICLAPANAVPCTNFATTYTNAAESATCPSSATPANNTPLTRPGSNTCVGNSDGQGGWGVWMNPGTYQFTITTVQGSYGPYDFTVAATSGGGGGGGLPTPGGQPWISTYGSDVCASMLTLLGTGTFGTAGGQGLFLGPFATSTCHYNAAGAAPFGSYVYNQTTHSTQGPGFNIQFGPQLISTDVQWVNPFKSTLFGTGMISGDSNGFTIQASTAFVPWLQGCVVNGSAPLLTLTSCTATNAGGTSASYPFGLTGGNWIKIVGTNTCLDNAWRVDSSSGTSITIYYVQPGSGCTAPSLPVTVTKSYVPLFVNGNSSNGGSPGYGSVDAGAFVHDMAIECNPAGTANSPHPQNCIAMAGWTWNEGSGIENMDLKDTTSIGLDIEVPSLSSTGATGHPADYFVRNINILVDPFYTLNPTSNVDSSICELVNTHGDPSWYDLGGTCKVVNAGLQPADAIQVIGTQGAIIDGKHIEGFQNCVHFLAPTAPETSLNRAVSVRNITCAVFYTAVPGANILIDSGAGFPIDAQNISGLPSGGAILSDNESGFNTVYTGGDTNDGWLNHYAAIQNGFWRIDSTSYQSSVPGPGDRFGANSGGALLEVGNITTGTWTPYSAWTASSGGAVLSNENVGGGKVDIRTQGHSTTTQSLSIMPSNIQLRGTDSTNGLMNINYPSGFTGPHTASFGDYGGQFNLLDAGHTGGMECFNSSGQSTTGTTCSLSGAFNGTGTSLANFHHDQDVGTLAGGTLAVVLSGGSVFLNSTTYSCNARDTTTQANAVTVTYTDGTHFTLTGTGTDNVLWQCNGR